MGELDLKAGKKQARGKWEGSASVAGNIASTKAMRGGSPDNLQRRKKAQKKGEPLGEMQNKRKMEPEESVKLRVGQSSQSSHGCHLRLQNWARIRG